MSTRARDTADVVEDVNDALGSKVPFAYGTATPSTTVEGFVWYDENDSPPTPKFWDGSDFVPFPSGPGDAVITGTTGSPNVNTTDDPGFTIYTFTGDGSITVGTAGLVEVFIVGGGGSPGNSWEGQGGAGGGGGGGIVQGNFVLPAGSHVVKVGAGGPVTSGIGTRGYVGNPSQIGNIISHGGGGGGGSAGAGIGSGATLGGSGGGAGGAASALGGLGITELGNTGGDCTAIRGGAGGGGAGGVGANSNGNNGANGGVGAISTIISTTLATTLSVGQVSGSSVYYAGGGGGGGYTSTSIEGTGGLGGGGNGGKGLTTPVATAGAANTGGGAGGPGAGTTGGSGTRGAGGSGVVIIKVKV
jgi:hypothetical protein